MFAKNTRAAASPTSGASVLIVIITLLIILYILALPPAERADLLGDQPTIVTGPGINPQGNNPAVSYTGKETLLEETPGRIDYTALNELEIPLTSFTLYKTTSAKVLEEYNSFYIKNGVGDISAKNISLGIDNLNLIDNVILTFKTKKHEGILTIKLNSQTIYEYDIDTLNPEPIKIKKTLLSDNNHIEFSVSSVGWKFWLTNEYSFEGIKIIADVEDTSRQDTQNTFFVNEDQAQDIERATLRFHPECITSKVGKLTLKLNGRTVFSGIPDCGSPNFFEFTPNFVIIGKNKIDFSIDEGSYLIDLIKIKLEFKDNEIPVYYFDVDDRLFNLDYDELDPECGRKDGYCPEFCDEDNDYDCCMTKYTTPFWCVAKTANEDDRCVGFVTEDNLNRCPTNYVGRNGKVSEDGEDLCGDNHDDECPSGCDSDYDKDCCFDRTGDQFWCEFMPTNGLNYKCMDSVSLGQCDICPTGYIGEGHSPICRPSTTAYEVQELKPEYGIIISMKFTDDYQRKEADIYINGHLTRLQTNGALFQKDVSMLVEPGTNSIEIVPFSILNIREIKVDVVQ